MAMKFETPGASPALTRGWRQRQRDALAKRGDSEMTAIRAERARLAEEGRLRSEAQAREAAESRKVTRIVCPCCDGDATVTLAQAELVIRALARLPADAKIDADVMSMLTAIAAGAPIHNLHSMPTHRHLARPRAVAQVATEADTAEEAEALAEATATQKTKRGR